MTLVCLLNRGDCWVSVVGLTKYKPPIVHMKKTKYLITPACGLVCAAISAHANIVTIFSNAGDQSVFSGATTPQVDPIPDPLSASGWGVTSISGLDGDALRIWNTGSGRASIEYTAPQPYASGVEFNFDGIIESDSAGQYLWRIGAAGGNLAALGDSAAELRFNSGGNVRVRVDGTQTFDDVNVGLDTRFSISVFLNAAEAGGTSLPYDKFGISGDLDPQQFTVFVNESQVGTYLMQNTSANIGASWLATGTGANQAVPTMQIDNFQVVAVPEPQTYALLAGIFGLGLVVLRRRRLN